MRRAISILLRVALVAWLLGLPGWLIYTEVRETEQRARELAPVVAPSGWESRA